MISGLSPWVAASGREVNHIITLGARDVDRECWLGTSTIPVLLLARGPMAPQGGHRPTLLCLCGPSYQWCPLGRVTVLVDIHTDMWVVP